MPLSVGGYIPLDLARQHSTPLVSLLALPSSALEFIDAVPSSLRPLRNSHSYSFRLHPFHPPLRLEKLRQTPLRNLRHAALPLGPASTMLKTRLDPPRIFQRWEIPPARFESPTGASPPRRLRRHVACTLQALAHSHQFASSARIAWSARTG